MEGNKEDPLGEKPLFTDEKGNEFFPQEESDYALRRRIKEEERLKRLASDKISVPHKKISDVQRDLKQPIKLGIPSADQIESARHPASSRASFFRARSKK